jgi:DNA polymerase III subunit beta
MQFLIDRDKLLEVLSKLATIIDRKSAVPILHNIFLDVCAATVLLRSTDCDMQLVIPCPAEVTAQGQITVDGHLLHEILRKCPKGGQVGMTLGGTSKRRRHSSADADRLRITCGAAEFSLLTLPADDWPELQLGPDRAEFRLECRQFRALIEKTRLAISSDETRYYLGGIYLHALGESLAAVATDGHRLAVKTVPLPAGADDLPVRRDQDDGEARTKTDGKSNMPGIIIHKEAATAALKILPDSEIECELTASANLMRLRVGEVELIAKLIDGTYPDWQRVVPSGGTSRVIAPREALAKAVARVGVVLDERDGAIAMRIGPAAIQLTARSYIAGHEAREEVDDCVHDGDAIRIGVNPRYLAEILETMDGTQLAIVLQSGDGSSPLLFEEVDGDGSLRMVLMPMRLPGNLVQEAKKKAA